MTRHHVPQVDRATQTARGTHLIILIGTQAVLRERLSAEAERSALPDRPTSEPALKDLLLRIRREPHT